MFKLSRNLEIIFPHLRISLEFHIWLQVLEKNQELQQNIPGNIKLQTRVDNFSHGDFAHRPPEVGVTELKLKEIHVGEVPGKSNIMNMFHSAMILSGVSIPSEIPIIVDLLGKIMFRLLISHYSALPTCGVQFETLQSLAISFSFLFLFSYGC